MVLARAQVEDTYNNVRVSGLSWHDWSRDREALRFRYSSV